ncbi:hypothetical protein DPMN_057683 [Dreissena polymorpha]|uniref:Protein quiver n=1 Tax=Dreissena polymorpha TaxID=45954 RepID=A0A9D4HCE9_DREPO|nr:hypothetical protein DPMN_057683 [Dreissena polymorpha]
MLRKLLIYSVLCIGFVHQCTALACYNCSSHTLPGDCGDTFRLQANNKTYIHEECESCVKIYTKATKLYERKCKPKRPDGFNFTVGCKYDNERITCHCHDNLCNVAARDFMSFAHLCVSCVILLFSSLSK